VANNAPAVFPKGTTTVTWTVTDTSGNSATATQTVTVQDHEPPSISGEILAPTEPLIVHSQANVSVEFTENCGVAIAVWYWGDGNSYDGVVTGVGSSGSVSGSHVYDAPGDYTVALQITDHAQNSIEASFSYIIVYDPEGPFVAGGSWIDSTAGAFAANPGLTGKATFGFTSKYSKGASTLSGNTEFQFRLGNLNLHSQIQKWLVVSGAKAQYKGTGTINGTGSYGVLLTVSDGQISSGGGPDLLRIKIWDLTSNRVVYDNVAGQPDDLGRGQPISSGSIVIHR
jgi:PKD repeat protein